MSRKTKRRRAKESRAARAALASMMQLDEDTPEYWEAFKEYAKEEAAAAGNESPRTVNGISVNDPDFTRLVLDSTKEQDPICIKYETKRKTRSTTPPAQISAAADPAADQSAQDVPGRA